jgi:hypothetical protein
MPALSALCCTLYDARRIMLLFTVQLYKEIRELNVALEAKTKAFADLKKTHASELGPSRAYNALRSGALRVPHAVCHAADALRDAKGAAEEDRSAGTGTPAVADADTGPSARRAQGLCNRFRRSCWSVRFAAAAPPSALHHREV